MKSRQPFAQRDYRDPRRRAKSGVVRAASRALRPLGVDVELRHFYSPIPHAETIAPRFWQQPSLMPGVPQFDTIAQLEFLERELAPAIAEFTPPRGWPGAGNEFFLDNGLFQGGDADVLYAMVRRFRPSRILELGAGFSTLVSALACERNLSEGHSSALITCDPYAIPPSPGAVRGLRELRRVGAERLGIEEFTRLGKDDILFIDSSHTVKVGGDVTHLLLEVIPRLAPGVLVHLHDIFLPWNYPRDWIEHNRWYWAEQYMLQALMVGNSKLQPLFAAYAVTREHSDRFARLVKNYRAAVPPLSFWLRIVGP